MAVGVIIVVIAFILAAALTFAPQQAYNEAKARVDNAEQPAANAVATAAEADTDIATAADTIRNANLAKAMIDHNDVYPKLYSDVRQYIPSFFRLTSMSAVPIDGTSSSVTLVGTLQSYQQYAEVILSLMRWSDPTTHVPVVTSISRTGYNYDVPQVPAVGPDDPVGMPHKSSEPVLPPKQLDRLAYFESQNYAPKGYLGLNNFGTEASPKGATPDESEVTITMTVNRDLEVPDVAATLGGGGGGGGGASLAMGMGRGGPGGPVGGGGAAAAAAGGSATGRRNSTASD
jgi:hypothetical protein